MARFPWISQRRGILNQCHPVSFSVIDMQMTELIWHSVRFRTTLSLRAERKWKNCWRNALTETHVLSSLHVPAPEWWHSTANWFRVPAAATEATDPWAPAPAAASIRRRPSITSSLCTRTTRSSSSTARTMFSSYRWVDWTQFNGRGHAVHAVRGTWLVGLKRQIKKHGGMIWLWNSAGFMKFLTNFLLIFVHFLLDFFLKNYFYFYKIFI